jgi:hypothetical protein
MRNLVTSNISCENSVNDVDKLQSEGFPHGLIAPLVFYSNLPDREADGYGRIEMPARDWSAGDNGKRNAQGKGKSYLKDVAEKWYWEWRCR